MLTYGFVASGCKHGGVFYTYPATRDEHGEIKAYDLSGFLGSCVITGDYKFFASRDGSSLCSVAMFEANNYCEEKNNV